MEDTWLRGRLGMLLLVGLLAGCQQDPVAPPPPTPPSEATWTEATVLGGGFARIASSDRVYAVVREGGSLRLRTSEDEGATWSDAQVITPNGVVVLYRTFAAVGQTLHLLTEASDGHLWYWRSDDGGDSWPVGTQLSENQDQLAHRASLAIQGQYVHVVNSRQFNSPNRQVTYWRSTDGGSTWASPLVLDDEATGGAVNPDIATDGIFVHVTYELWEPPEGGPRQNIYRHSSDNGATWEPGIALSDEGQLRPRVAARNGRVISAWETPAATQNREVQVRRSTTNGTSWQARQTVLRQPGRNLGHPILAAGPGGDIHIAAFDDLDPGAGAWHAESLDYGTTWTDQGIVTATASQPVSFAVSAGYVHLIVAPPGSPSGPSYHLRRERR